MVERGLAVPGSLVVGSDSHTCMYGALGVLATGIDRTEAAALILTGEMWLKIPQSIRVDLRGRLAAGATAKDLILSIIGRLGADGANYQCVEFHGDTEPLSIDDRLTVANMGVEMGAKAAVFRVDRVAEEYLKSVGLPPLRGAGAGCGADAAPNCTSRLDADAYRHCVRSRPARPRGGPAAYG